MFDGEMEGKIIVVLFCSLVPSFGYNIWKYAEAHSIQSTIRECSLLDEQTVDDDEPLTASEHVQRLQIASLKERADQIRRRYNRGRRECQVVREHLMELSEHGYIYPDVREQVEAQLKGIEERNDELKKQYNEIVLFAEKYYAEAMTKRISQETEQTAQLLDEKNQILLQSVELPKEMQERNKELFTAEYTQARHGAARCHDRSTARAKMQECRLRFAPKAASCVVAAHSQRR